MYDEAYLREYEARAHTPIGQAIYCQRWDLVQKYCTEGTLLDYGCGAGAFHESAPEGFRAYGYDINPHSPHKTPLGKVDILTMWDVIEHLVLPTEPLELCNPQWVFLCTPNIDNATQTDLFGWKHYKPGEHLHYFNLKSLMAVLGCAGYVVMAYDFEEGTIRDPQNPEAILSVAARKRNA